MRHVSRVLCAVSIDERDRRVFEHALSLARRHDAAMLLLHAASPQQSFNQGAAERDDFLRRLRSQAEAAGVETRVTVQTGPVDEIILLHARAREADLIVIGTGDGGGRPQLSGRLAERVLREAPCPTLVVPHASPLPEWTAAAVLCAVDDSPAAQAAALAAMNLAPGGGRSVTLLHVVDGQGSGERAARGWLVSQQYQRALGADALERLRRLIPPTDRAVVQARVAIGRPVPEILATAQALEAQLIVIGATSRTRIGSRLFGKTAELLRGAACPVLAVPAARAAGADADVPLRAAA